MDKFLTTYLHGRKRVDFVLSCCFWAYASLEIEFWELFALQIKTKKYQFYFGISPPKSLQILTDQGCDHYIRPSDFARCFIRYLRHSRYAAHIKFRTLCCWEEGVWIRADGSVSSAPPQHYNTSLLAAAAAAVSDDQDLLHSSRFFPYASSQMFLDQLSAGGSTSLPTTNGSSSGSNSSLVSSNSLRESHGHTVANRSGTDTASIFGIIPDIISLDWFPRPCCSHPRPRLNELGRKKRTLCYVLPYSV